MDADEQNWADSSGIATLIIPFSSGFNTLTIPFSISHHSHFKHHSHTWWDADEQNWALAEKAARRLPLCDQNVFEFLNVSFFM